MTEGLTQKFRLISLFSVVYTECLYGRRRGTYIQCVPISKASPQKKKMFRNVIFSPSHDITKITFKGGREEEVERI